MRRAVSCCTVCCRISLIRALRGCAKIWIIQNEENPYAEVICWIYLRLADVIYLRSRSPSLLLLSVHAAWLAIATSAIYKHCLALGDTVAARLLLSSTVVQEIVWNVRNSAHCNMMHSSWGILRIRNNRACIFEILLRSIFLHTNESNYSTKSLALKIALGALGPKLRWPLPGKWKVLFTVEWTKGFFCDGEYRGHELQALSCVTFVCYCLEENPLLHCFFFFFFILYRNLVFIHVCVCLWRVQIAVSVYCHSTYFFKLQCSKFYCCLNVSELLFTPSPFLSHVSQLMLSLHFLVFFSLTLPVVSNLCCAHVCPRVCCP